VPQELEELFYDAYQARKEQRSADAKRALLTAVDFCRESNVPGDLARALTALGQIERDLSNTEVARQHYEEAIAIYREHGDMLRLAHSVRHVGDIYLEGGQLAAAEPFYQEALNLYRAHASTAPLDLANTLRGFALLRQESGQNNEARQLWSEARDLYQSVNVQAGVAESTRRLAQLNV
jgi:tetratricopeptide (TPR) repeat protein